MTEGPIELELTGELFELDSLINWMRVFSSTARCHESGEVVVHVYGEGDDSYMVIEKQVSAAPMSVDQYVVNTLDFGNPLMTLVKLLRAFDFRLDKLLSRLAAMEYDGQDGSTRLEGIDVFHHFIQETPADKGNGAANLKSAKQKASPKPKAQVVVTKRKLDPAIIAKAKSFGEVARSLSPIDDKKPSSGPSSVEEFEEWE